MTKQFTLLQLFPLVDKYSRIISAEDTQQVLGHIFNTVVSVHEIPDYLVRLRRALPFWYTVIAEEVDTICVMYDNDIKKIIEAIKSDYGFMKFDIPQIIY